MDARRTRGEREKAVVALALTMVNRLATARIVTAKFSLFRAV
jgi:hypothetical protein